MSTVILKSNSPSVDLCLRISGFALAAGITAFAFSKALLLAGVYISIAAWIAARLLERKPVIPKTRINFYIWLMLGALVISIAHGGDWSEGIRGLNKWLRGIFLMWVSYDLLREPRRQKILSIAIVIAFTAAAVDGLVQYWLGRDLFHGYPLGDVNALSRVTSSFGHFGLFACFLLMTMPMVVSFATKQKGRLFRIILIVAILILGFVNLYLTRSRGAWLAAFAAGCFLLAALRRWRVFLLLLVLLIAAPFVLPKTLVFHYRRTAGIDKTIGRRLILWKQAVNIFLANSVFGCGLNTYVKNIEKYNPGDQGEVRAYYAHNGYLQHAAETGLLGLVSLLAFLGRYFYLVRRYWWKLAVRVIKLPTMLITGIFSFLVYMSVDTIFHNLQPFLLFWLMIGWSLAAVEQEEALIQ